MEDNKENVEKIEIEEQNNTNPEPENTKQEQETEVQNKEIAEVKKNKKESYILGTIGAILGGGVAAIPWIVTYMFTNNIVIPLLAILIPIGAFFGYKIFKGKITKTSRVIIALVSILIIVLVTNIICPIIFLYKSGYDPTWSNLVGLYSDDRDDVKEMLVEDLAAGLLFAIVGIVITIKCFINKKLEDILSEERKIAQEKKKGKLKEQSEMVKKACIDLNCMNEEKAIKKEEILEQLKIVYNIKRKKAKLYFKNCLSNELLKKYKGKYYYDETDEATKIENVKKVKSRYVSPIKAIATILIIAIIVAAVVLSMITSYTIPDTDIKLRIDPITQKLYGTKEDISKNIGEATAQYYDFIIEEKEEKYEVSGQLIEKSVYEESELYDSSSVIQQDRDYFADYFGEEDTSEIEDKELSGKSFKFYYYNYISNTDKECRAHVYLYEAGEKYLWVEVRTIREHEIAEMDAIIENLFK